MENDKDKKIGVESENVAIPEIVIGEKEPENDEKNAGEIDYDCAVPEVHFRHEKED